MVLGKINHFYFKISAKRLKREMQIKAFHKRGIAPFVLNGTG